ncbi:MAG: endogenous inhibitor of DNA gyrase (YacG/DUF329 family) [Mariniblastus sp.]|jgi:endogenous inhibitor of DNA gyrase (YacG/DUF329 family)
MRYDQSSDYESGDSMGGSNSDDAMPTEPKQSNSGPENSSPAPAASLHRCSYCGQSFDRAESKHMPFCGKRCQMIDLGTWLNEGYSLPCEGESSLDTYGVVDDPDEY